MNAALQIAHGGPALLLLHLWVVVEDPVPEPRQVVNPQLVLFAWITREKWFWRFSNRSTHPKEPTPLSSQVQSVIFSSIS